MTAGVTACVLAVLAAGPFAHHGEGADGMDFGAFKVSRLTCVIGNNAGKGEHLGGYNGVFAMARPGEDDSPFVPFYAGLNLEHYFDASPRNPDNSIFFEPRHAAMGFRRLSDTAAELYQAPTPHFGMESWTRFELKEPYYVDFSFRCKPTKDVFEGGYFGVFWASYINAPIDKSIYFLSGGATLAEPRWLQLCTQQHGRDSTVRAATDEHELPFPDEATTLFNGLSPLRYGEPFFYGRFRDSVLIYIFEPGPCIRLAHSPSGGGSTAAGDDTNPAWDFQLIVPDYEVGQEYGLRGRLVYKPWEGREDVLREVAKYRDEP